jgi:hypothetical protein
MQLVAGHLQRNSSEVRKAEIFLVSLPHISSISKCCDPENTDSYIFMDLHIFSIHEY